MKFDADQIIENCNMAKKAAKALVDVAKEKMHKGGSRIFILDDDPDEAEVLKHRLQKRKYRCVVGTSPIDFYKTLKENDIGLLITDLEMPGLDGIEVIELMKGNRLPVILYTGHHPKAPQLARLLEWDIPIISKDDHIDKLLGAILVEFRSPIESRRQER